MSWPGLYVATGSYLIVVNYHTIWYCMQLVFSASMLCRSSIQAYSLHSHHVQIVQTDLTLRVFDVNRQFFLYLIDIKLSNDTCAKFAL